MTKQAVYTQDAPNPIGPYSQAIRAGGFLFCSGQIPLDPATGEMVAGDSEAQTRRALENLGAVLRAGGSEWDRVVKATIYVTDLADFPLVNRLYAEKFSKDPPARAVVQVAALPKGAKVEIECWAQVG